MEILSSKAALKAFRAKCSGTVGFIPTMGALHDGHLSLVRSARKQCDTIIVSIFVNPTQFGQNEDFDTYPRTEEEDCAKLKSEKVDAVYLPTRDDIYPEGFSTRISVGKIYTGILCGQYRPTFFDGVCLIVSKLLNQVNPTHAFFGEKDFQQLFIIQKICRELDIDVDIVPVPIIREPDGLAMSSRNAYLSKEERAIAPILYQALTEAAESAKKGEGTIDSLTKHAKASLLKAGFESVDYIDFRSVRTLRPINSLPPKSPTRVFGAARFASCRILDNVEV